MVLVEKLLLVFPRWGLSELRLGSVLWRLMEILGMCCSVTGTKQLQYAVSVGF